MSKRRHARERVLQALYAASLSGDSDAHVIKTVIAPRLKSDDAMFGFAKELFGLCLNHEEEAIDIIEKHSQNWDLERIAVVDRLVLQMAIIEFLHVEDVPPKVTMNELIEIAKKYSTAKSGRFVNGVLDAILETLMREGRIRKRGRGLVGMETEDLTESATGASEERH